MAEAIVGPLVGKLQELVVSEAKALVAVNDDIRGLRDKLMWMQAFLRHADPRRRDASDEFTRVWLTQTRDVAFDAEDAIDHYFLKVDLSRYPSLTRSIIRFFAGFTTQLSVRQNLSRKIVEINSRIEDIIQNKEKYKSEVAPGYLAPVPWKPSPNTSNVAANPYHFQPPPIIRPEAGDLEDALTNINKGRVVIYVTGEHGVGKATLVREILEKPTTRTQFREGVWASFPPNLSSSNILQLINQQLEEKSTWRPSRGIDKVVRRNLTQKRFLLVIDGEVGNTEWNAILHALPDDGNGSRVIRIMQGRNEPPRITATQIRIELHHFDKRKTIELFYQRVSVEENSKDQEMTDEISKKSTMVEEMGTEATKREFGDDIYGITRGLPLAVVLLSGLVQTKEFPTEWQAVFEHLRLKKSKLLDNILAMCFDDLPHDLKSCFLYFAALPMNTPLEASKLIFMWMAEGFIRPKDGKTMEKVGRIYLRELVTRNLVKSVTKMGSFIDDGDEFVAVHHKVHSFLQVEALESNFVDIHSGDDNHSLSTARRLSLQNYKDKYAALANSLPKLRSVFSNFQEEAENLQEEAENLEESMYGDNNERFQEEVQNDEEDNGEQQEEVPDDEEDTGKNHIKEEEILKCDGGGEEIEHKMQKQKEEDVAFTEEHEEQIVEGKINLGGENNKEGEKNDRQKNVEGEGEQNGHGVEIEMEGQNIEDQRDGGNVQEGLDEGDRKSADAVPNERNEKATRDIKSGILLSMSNILHCFFFMENVLHCWGQGTKPPEYVRSYVRGMLKVSKFLRVINLQGVEVGKKLPARIGNMAHLQYLGITACSLKIIPSTIGRLKNLQTFDVRDTYVLELPSTFWKIKTLRHVFGTGLSLPKRVGNLKHLQTLEGIQPDKSGWDSKTFERMVHLRSLSFFDLSENSSNAKALSDVIGKPDSLEYLVKLSLYTRSDIIPLSVFTSSSQRRLRTLNVWGKLDYITPSKPKVSKFYLPNLTFLELIETEVPQDFINKLGKLPLLAELILNTNSYKDDQGHLVFRAGGFESLTKILLLDLENLKKLTIGKSALPELTDLMIIQYPEDIQIKVHGERRFVKKIQDDDEDLYARIIVASTSPKKIVQDQASSSM